MMNPNPFSVPEDSLDASIRRELDREAAQVNAQAMFASALARLDAEVEPARQPRRRFLVKAAAITALAAAVLVVFFFIPPTQMASANPSEALASARKMHSDGVDRCYTVKLDGPPMWLERMEKFFGEPQPIFTRGDRYFQRLANGRGVWGRDADGHIWIAPTRDAAARFGPSELPKALREIATVRGLELPQLLDETLADFELTWSEDNAKTRVVLAQRRGPVGPLQIAIVAIRLLPKSDTIQELIVTRALPSGQTARLTYTLIECEPQSDAAYTPSGHLEPQAPVYNSDRPLLRRRVIVQHLGEAILNGL